MSRLFTVTPLRKIGIGFFVAASSFAVVAWIEGRIQSGMVTSVWWQVLAYAILTSGEVLISITAIEYSYKQAPLRMKSFIMTLYLLALSFGNMITALVSANMVEPIQGVELRAGEVTTVLLPAEADFVSGQKIDFSGDTGITVDLGDGKSMPLAGTYVVGEIRERQAQLLDVVQRKPIATSGHLESEAQISTYKLVGPQFFMFFFYLMLGTGLVWTVVSRYFTEQTHVREDN